MWVSYFKPQGAPAVVDLDEISDPVQRFCAELTGSIAITEEFDDFIKVKSSTLLLSLY